MTLSAAAPADFGAWRTWVEQQLRAVGTAAMSRPALAVTKGNFNVRGGGSLYVYDGGQITTLSADGRRADLYNGALWIRSTPDVYWGKVTSDVGLNPTYITITPPFYEANGEQTDTYLILDGARPGSTGRAYLQVGKKMLLSGDDDDLVLGATTHTLWLQGSRIQLLGVTPTSSAANLRIDGGRLYTSTSSRRYKTDEAPAAIDPDAVLSLEPKTWRDKAAVAEVGDAARWHAGLVAEDVDAAGLSVFVDYDDDGRPDALQYDRLGTAGLLTVARRQHEQITDLQAENTALSDRLARLEAHLGLQDGAGVDGTTSPAQEATP